MADVTRDGNERGNGDDKADRNNRGDGDERGEENERGGGSDFLDVVEKDCDLIVELR